MIGDKKTVYHSALVKEGPVVVTITSDGPVQSKHRGQPDFIGLKHEGFDHYYVVENDQCGEALTGLRGQTVTIEATGSRDDADIIVTDDAPPQRKPAPRQDARHHERAPQRQERQQERSAPAPRQPARHERPAKPTPEVALSKAKVHGAKVAVLMRSSFLHASKILTDLGYVLGKEYSFEDLRAVAISHFIETKGSTDIDALPVQWIAKGATVPTRKPEPEPEPEPEPPVEDNDDLYPDDVPF